MDKKTEQGIQRFFRNKKIKPKELIEGIKQSCSDNCPEGHVLVITDTVELNYNQLAGKLRVNDQDIGYISDNRSAGFLAHPALAVEAQQGLPLGLSEIILFERRMGQADKKERGSQGLPIEEKESNKWILAAQGSKACLSNAGQLTFISDRESDIYEFFCKVPDARTHVVIRSNYDRVLVGGKKRSEVLRTRPWEEGLRIKIRGKENRTAREAQMQLRWTTVELAKPQSDAARRGALKNYPQSVPLQLVELCEKPETVSPGEEPVHWILWTTHPVNTLAQAIQITKGYANRWWIEDLFRLIKTKGFQVESSQFGTGQALKKLVVSCLDQGWKILLMRQERNGKEQLPARMCFTQEECQALAFMQPPLEGPTDKQKNPHPEQTLAWAVWLVARLGGWKPADLTKRPPGVITLRRGLGNFYQRMEGWSLALALLKHSSKFET